MVTTQLLVHVFASDAYDNEVMSQEWFVSLH